MIIIEYLYYFDTINENNYNFSQKNINPNKINNEKIEFLLFSYFIYFFMN